MTMTNARPTPRLPSTATPVRIRGTDYPSMGAAARSLRVHLTTVARALDAGRLENVGLYRKAGKPRSCVVNGIEYPSMIKAAEAVGMDAEVFRRRYREQVFSGAPITHPTN